MARLGWLQGMRPSLYLEGKVKEGAWRGESGRLTWSMEKDKQNLAG